MPWEFIFLLVIFLSYLEKCFLEQIEMLERLLQFSSSSGGAKINFTDPNSPSVSAVVYVAQRPSNSLNNHGKQNQGFILV